MNYFLAQIIPAVQNRDVEDWTNILFIVVVAVLWAIGGIIKARANKTKLEEDEEESARKPTERERGVQKQLFERPRRPASPAPRKLYQPQVQQPSRKAVGPRLAVQKFVTEAKEAVEPVLESLEVPKPKLSVPIPQVQAKLQEVPDFTSKAIEKLKHKYASTAAETPQAKYLSEILLDYSDPDELRRAILHYEILGTPWALREPTG
jgi:hypothetical protein